LLFVDRRTFFGGALTFRNRITYLVTVISGFGDTYENVTSIG
jgi:hypothetical protein